ncbi:hypothetical protein COW36_19375 [bacterium (Candidatus Blackallbacteria) CG17_big_fil_post_rev_8_21_14_2_50_48_46]|uniref:N-acetyltransferase domain-containing protein n=1 Tax=bacterium (Candidatus Blackallbacteria) CG17_big_fil_post_rev_8_21_14_2_50_48_46 TaxID=2014261 RepID=A0A2M7G0S5_9BACT|nr:MAG: hypothetical protein COW64_25095 [bacterium (Candidatus Blackallbacteria) CG18_big_fil_WC_8_21_14_2_50_49_26]PIW15085.1 MAG: hypothetical protein COW36_19375 [bacterium (Candidatus Blackallbacteria) CG17_big_fil_post_rev_8_21_14_2_50_48_46]PIW47592.1 MAG: hypothetical protein COW20_11945 [bacterium (Candidatus Blackallbacteria) CG13_big_fil_rev_8_21_14_2_50_49_14]
MGNFQENFFWSGLKSYPLEPEVFQTWQIDPDIQAFLGQIQGETVVYAEWMLNPDLGELEIMRLIVAPEHRGKGVGKAFLQSLLKQVSELEASFPYRAAYARIFPQNDAAQRCFSGAGFDRVSPEREAHFNQWDSVDFVWLEHFLQVEAIAS